MFWDTLSEMRFWDICLKTDLEMFPRKMISRSTLEIFPWEHDLEKHSRDISLRTWSREARSRFFPRWWSRDGISDNISEIVSRDDISGIYNWDSISRYTSREITCTFLESVSREILLLRYTLEKFIRDTHLEKHARDTYVSREVRSRYICISRVYLGFFLRA